MGVSKDTTACIRYSNSTHICLSGCLQFLSKGCEPIKECTLINCSIVENISKGSPVLLESAVEGGGVAR